MEITELESNKKINRIINNSINKKTAKTYETVYKLRKKTCHQKYIYTDYFFTSLDL